MSRGHQPDSVRQLFMALWGLGTLILLFVVILLVSHLMKSGQDPFDAVRPRAAVPTAATAPRAVTSLGQRSVQLYFADAEGKALAAEERAIEFSDSTQENCRNTLNLLLAGPQSESLGAVFPAQVPLRALYLQESGELVLDFSRDLISAGARLKSASFESLLVYAIVNTLTQPSLQAKGGLPVRQVRFLFEGAPPQEGFPAHIDLSAPIRPDSTWLAAK